MVFEIKFQFLRVCVVVFVDHHHFLGSICLKTSIRANIWDGIVESGYR